MPLITVTYSSFRKTPRLKAEIASAVRDLTARILRKDPKVTAIIVRSVDAADPTPRTRRPPISPQCSSAWVSCSDRCTTRAMRTSTK